MNKEYYVVGDKYCSVIADDGQVTMLCKDNQYDRNSSFTDLLIRENYLEDAENEKSEIINRIKELSGWKRFSFSLKVGIVIALCATLLIITGALFAAPEVEMLLSNGFVKVALFGSIIPIASVLGMSLIQKLDDWKEVRKLKKYLPNLEKEIKEIKEEIAKDKQNISVADYLIEPSMTKDVAREVDSIIENDGLSARLNAQKNERILRNTMNEYLERGNIPAEKGRMYSIGKISRRK